MVGNGLKSVLKIAKGARELCRALKALGYKIAVVSGGFQPRHVPLVMR
jgi:phosphoserine phosphatase